MCKKQQLTYSRLRSFRECPRKEFLRYEAGLRSNHDDTVEPLVFGRLWHECMADFYTLIQKLDGREILSATGAGIYLLGTGTIARHARLSVGMTPEGPIEAWSARQRADRTIAFSLDPDADFDKIDEMEALAYNMFNRYIDTWWEHDLASFEVVCVEQTMSAALRTKNGTASSKWDYSGVPDAVVKSKATGKYWVVEHKSTVDVEKMLSECVMDNQGVGYCWLVAETLTDPSEIGGVIYRATRKKIPSEPAMLLSGAVSSSKCDTTPEIYERALKLAEADGHERKEKHCQILAALKARGMDRWAGQKILYVDKNALDSWRDETYVSSLAKNAAQTYGESGHWRIGSPSVCYKYGRPCSYMPLCETNEPALVAYENDFVLQNLFSLRTPHEELGTVH